MKRNSRGRPSMDRAAGPARKCSECESDCQCGCQSNLFSLPLEILEQILQYEDPITLTALERTSRYLAYIVSKFWVKYCRQRNFDKRPTPLCLGWNGLEDDFYSYDKAVDLSHDTDQRWRIAAVRLYLRQNRQCVVCHASCKNIPLNELFTASSDVLLCYRCLPHFTITVTHDLVHALDDVGVRTMNLHMSFGTLLLSQFIRILRSNSQDEKEVLQRLRSFARPSSLSPIEIRRNRPFNLALPVSSELYPNIPGRCCCSATQCSAAREHAPSHTQSTQDPTRARPFYIILGIFLFVNTFEFVHGLVVLAHFKVISIAQEQPAHFVMVACIEVALLVCCFCYLLINCYQRYRKTTWNQSFATVLQCFVLACLLVEIIEAVLAKTYAEQYVSTTRHFFQTEVNSTLDASVFAGKINWIEGEYNCCVPSANKSDASESSGSHMNPSSDPRGCCSTSSLSCEKGRLPSCLPVLTSILIPLTQSFAWTNITCSVLRIMFLWFICFSFRGLRRLRPPDTSPSLQTIFTMS